MDFEHVTLDHGSGGLLSGQLIGEVIVAGLGAAHSGSGEDATLVDAIIGSIAITTDSFVVSPIFFNGGDIGKLAVCGTVNDLAVSGAIPLYLTLAMVIEEGFSIRDLCKIVESIRDAALDAKVRIVAGDTKVVAKGELDGVMLCTTGVGAMRACGYRSSVRRIQVGDSLVLSGSIGNHSVQLLSLREGLGYEAVVTSDCASLAEMIDAAIKDVGTAIHCMRDVTRGGLGGILNEIASETSMTIELRRRSLPIQAETHMACEMLGISPLYLANEGCALFFVDPCQENALVEALRKSPYGRLATAVGHVAALREGEGRVVEVDERLVRRVVGPLVGRVLPRLC